MSLLESTAFSEFKPRKHLPGLCFILLPTTVNNIKKILLLNLDSDCDLDRLQNVLTCCLGHLLVSPEKFVEIRS